MISPNLTPYTAFGKTKLVPIRVYVDGKLSSQTWFQNSLWIERWEDWYALSNKVPTLVVERADWLRVEDYTP